MTKIKILCVLNRLSSKSKKKAKSNTKTLQKYFEKDIKKAFRFLPIEIEVDFIETDFDTEITKGGTNTQGIKFYFLKKNKAKLRKLGIDKNKYHSLFFCYDEPKLDRRKGYVAPASFWKPLYPATGYVEVPMLRRRQDFVHEMCHEITKILKRQRVYAPDSMDIMLVKGKWVPYYKDNYPLAKGGNHWMTILFWQQHYGKFNGLFKTKKLVTVKTTVKKTKKEIKKWKYFSAYEVVNLKEELVKMLDKSRGYSGIPYVITSGYRTKAKNKAVGGVRNSEHLTREAVDIRARTPREVFLIVQGAIKAGFTRIGINEKKKFVHLGISKTKPQKVLWRY